MLATDGGATDRHVMRKGTILDARAIDVRTARTEFIYANRIPKIMLT